MDICDRAAEVEELWREQALARQAARSARGVSARWCQNAYCGAEIPDERRTAIPGAQLCVDCQKSKERGER